MKPENKTMRDIPNPQTSGPDQKRLSVYGKTPPKLCSFLVQIDPGRRENVTIDAYADGALFDAPACALACECESETAARKMVADIHYALVGYLTNRIRRSHVAITRGDAEKRERQIMLNLLSFALYCRDHLRFVMLSDDVHRAMYEDMIEIVDEAEKLLVEELPRFPAGQLVYGKGGDHDDKPNQEHVFMGDAETSAPGTIDPGADPVAGDCQGAGNSRL